MSTPRRRYRIDVTPAEWLPEGYATIVRHHALPINWAWCPHTVRATSNRSALAKAIQAHQASSACQALDAEIAAVQQEPTP